MQKVNEKIRKIEIRPKSVQRKPVTAAPGPIPDHFRPMAEILRLGSVGFALVDASC
jgi:hypothetical protein